MVPCCYDISYCYKILADLKALMEPLNNRYEEWYTKTALNQELKMDNAIKIFSIYFKENDEIYIKLFYNFNI